MNAEIKAAWLAALRSGEYAQTRTNLKDETGYCCLGVLCDLHAKAGLGKWGENGYYIPADDYAECSTLPHAVVRWAGVKDHNPDVYDHDDDRVPIAELNDHGYTFAELADIIEQQL